MQYAHIVGWGKYLPEAVITNDDLARIVDTTDGWIRERTGIIERRLASQRETSASMAIAASIAALDVAGLSGSQLDLIVVATSTPERTFPSTACAVQDALGAAHAGAFDLSAACSGFVYALGVAADGIKSGAYHHALVIGSEAMSRIVDWNDRNTCVLFGDGAGAVVLSGSDQPGGVLATLLRADGSGGDVLALREIDGQASNSLPDSLPRNRQTIQMNGREVFRFATRVMDRAAREVMHRVGWLPDQVDLVVPHQANIRIIETASRSLGIPLDKFYCNIQRYGNTSAASIPIALCEAVEEGRLEASDRLVMVGFGAGLTWAAAAAQWGPPRTLNRRQKFFNRVGYGMAGARSRARRALRDLEARALRRTDPDAPAPAPRKAGTPPPPTPTPTPTSTSTST
jgi:3-oxoacyl-[acyl-carrier-protein] synthase-3